MVVSEANRVRTGAAASAVHAPPRTKVGVWLGAFLALWLGVAHAGELAGKVIRVADGDTITILDAAQAHHTIRLAGIDAPEKGQAFGTKSREPLSSMVRAILDHKESGEHNEGGELYATMFPPEARRWWANRGVEFFNTEYGEDGILTLSTYLATRRDQGAAKADQGDAAGQEAEPADAGDRPPSFSREETQAVASDRAGQYRHDQAAQEAIAAAKRGLRRYSSTGDIPNGVFRPVRLPDDPALQAIAGAFGK